MVLFLAGSPLHAEPTVPSISQSPSPQSTGVPVVFAGVTLFTVYDKMGSFGPQERAVAIAERLSRLSENPLIRVDRIIVMEGERTSEIVSGDVVIVEVTEGDARPLGRSRQEVAQEYALTIRHALTTSLEQKSAETMLLNGAYALLDTVILIVCLVAFYKFFPKLYEKLQSWRGTYIPPIKIQRVEVVSAGQIASALIGLAKGLRVVATLFLLYLWVTAGLGIFSWTRGISARLVDAVLTTLGTIGLAFVTYVPNVVSIIVIVFVTRYIIKLIAMIFTGMTRGAITIPGFHREWIQPTYKIVRFLVIVFAVIASFPYIPGSQSDGFRGISVFLGVLISLGAAGAVSNIIAGVVLTYMLPFRDGDRVKIADSIGDVIERNLLVTRVRTIKNVDITIPNAMVLSSHLINFSSVAREQGLILHTTVTIGYDVPWKTVHALLIAAARTTTHILQTPEPFVLQTSLNDFYVTYEINAYTDQANKMASILCELHQNIQDKFNEAGVEIMSPHYAQIRDGNQTTIPEQYLPKHYKAPAFQVGLLDKLFGGSKDTGPGKGESRL
jgi:small-conductance mechanosensitive channel